MKLQISLATAITIALIVGCDTTNTDGAGLPSDGFIKGTVETLTSADQPANFSFEYTTVDYPAEYYPEQTGTRTIWIYRAEGLAGTWTGDHYSRIAIQLDSLNQDTVALYYVRLNAYTPLANDTMFGWGMNVYNTGRITDYHYDASSKVMNGKYTISATAFNGKPITVNGEFQTTVRMYLYGGN